MVVSKVYFVIKNMRISLGRVISKLLRLRKIFRKSDQNVTKSGENWTPSWKISQNMTKMWQPEKIVENMTKIWQIGVCHIFPEKNVTTAFKIWPISDFCHKMWQTEHPDQNLNNKQNNVLNLSQTGLWFSNQSRPRAKAGLFKTR